MNSSSITMKRSLLTHSTPDLHWITEESQSTEQKTQTLFSWELSQTYQ